MVLSKDQIKHIAKLARLELSDEELEKYGSQLSATLGYIEMLREVDTTDVEPTAQVTGLSNVMRTDQILAWDESQREAALKEAPDREERFIKVKKVFD
jgi:aspartyl-tRNA(Asn)/glutamyl-tRNA(Gln) amidotransferase subunit C